MTKRKYCVKTTIQIGNCVEVDVMVAGTYTHAKATREDPEETDLGIESVTLADSDDDDHILDTLQQVLEAEVDRKAPWIDETEDPKITKLLRDCLLVTFQGEVDDARKILNEYIDKTVDEDDLADVLMELEAQGKLY